MAKNKSKSIEPDFLEEENKKLTDAFLNAEYFFEKYRNIIIGTVAAIVLIGGGYWVYTNMIKGPKESKAKDAIYFAQNYFDMDSMQLALKGDGQHQGFEAVAQKFKGTAAGNRANFGAGVASLKLGKYADAIKYLSDFSTDDPLLNARKFGCIADAYAEQNQMDKAIENYKKAADAADNEFTTPTYNFRAALALSQKGNNKEALELYKKIYADFPNSQEGAASQIYIAKLEAQTF